MHAVSRGMQNSDKETAPWSVPLGVEGAPRAMALLVQLCHTGGGVYAEDQGGAAGDGTAGGGACSGASERAGRALARRVMVTHHCHVNDANGPWEITACTTCANADSDVPSGQGDGKYGDISCMGCRECHQIWDGVSVLLSIRVLSSSCLLRLSLFSISDPTLTLVSPPPLLSRCPLHHQCFMKRECSTRPLGMECREGHRYAHQ